jgi:hypothetical protein
MAEEGKGIKWFIRAVFDRASGKQVETELTDALTGAGKKGGAGFLKELRAAFDKRMADLKVSLAKGLISPAQFKQQGAIAAKEFNTGLIAGMDQARKAGTLTDREYLKLSKTLKTVGTDGQRSAGTLSTAFTRLGSQLAVLFGAQQIVRFFRESVTAAFEAEKSTNTLREALSKLGIAYSSVEKEAESYFAELQNTTRFTDDDARDALANLVTITGDYQKSLSLLNLTADVAAKRNTTMAAAAETVAKASLGLSKGMQDLGIKAGDTGDIIGKLRTNLGGLANSEGKELGTQVTILNNLWNEFKEKVGLAIIGSDRLGGSVGGLQQRLIELNKWMDENGESLGRFLDRLITAGSAVAKLGLFLLKWSPPGLVYRGWDALSESISGVGEAAEAASHGTDGMRRGLAARRALTATEQRALANLLEEGADGRIQITQAEVATLQRIRRDAASGLLTLTKEQDAAISKFLDGRARESADRAARQREQFQERKAQIEQEIRDLARLRAAQGTGGEGSVATQLQREADLRKLLEGLTRDQRVEITALVEARNQERDAIEAMAQAEKNRREADQALADDAFAAFEREHAEQVAIADANLRADATRKAVAAGALQVTTEADAALHAYNREQFIANELLLAGAEAGTTFGEAIAAAAGGAYDAAHQFVTPWQDALDKLRNEVEGSGTLFADLSRAWAEGGFAGIVAYAKAKVKENIAAAIENAAKAIGSLGLGNPLAAGKYAAAAAKHTAAAAAWKVAGSAAGGGGGGSAAAGGTTPGASGSTTAQAPGPEVHIYIDPLSPGDPRVQTVVRGAIDQAQERYGNNATVRVHRRAA